ncbi:hypothetical protein GGF37_003836 [Kickxella alabastrina]|nr:hypothetical protein GGF37_003836 [Kickxella alabastrina]
MNNSDQHVYPPRFPVTQHQSQHQLPSSQGHPQMQQQQHLASTWNRQPHYQRQQPMPLPAPTSHPGYPSSQNQPQQPYHYQQFQQKTQVQGQSTWHNAAGYIVGNQHAANSYSRHATSSPPATAVPSSNCAAALTLAVSNPHAHPYAHSHRSSSGSGSSSPYSLPSMSVPITPMTSVTPLINIMSGGHTNMTNKHTTANSIKSETMSVKRRRRANQDSESPMSQSSDICRKRDSQSMNSTSEVPENIKRTEDSPSVDGQTEAEAARILEERRRRNASASARFRKRRNERERELVNRCLFLEQHLLQAMGNKAFEEVMRKAPAAPPSIDGVPMLASGRRSIISSSGVNSMSVTTLSRTQSPKYEDEDADECDEDQVSTVHSSPTVSAGISVSALTAPASVDDVWSAYLTLSQKMAGALQRIEMLEDNKKKSA